MREKHYVIQYRKFEWDAWKTFATKYGTLEEAKTAAAEKQFRLGTYYRIAEAYTVVRYKAVKE